MIFLLSLLFFSDIAVGIQGGTLAANDELPFSVFIGSCTASLIGPQVLLTSARCKRSGQSVAFKLDEISYSGRCEAHPQSKPNRIDFDISLCKFEPAIVNEEILARFDPSKPVVGADAYIMGFGATLDGFGSKRFAEVSVKDVGPTAFTVDGNGRVGAGDTGSSVILDTDRVRGPFIVIGVALGLISDNLKTIAARVDNAEDFFAEFSEKNSAKICGLNSECRGNQDICQPERDIVQFFKDELDSAKELLNQCLEE